MTVKTVAAMGEFGLIEKLFASRQKSDAPGVVLGIGDDAAILAVPRTQHLLTTTDTMVEGIHFTSDADPYLLGQKLLRVNLSDMAAMGGVPRWYLLSLTLPPATTEAWAVEFARGLEEAAEKFQVTLVGGDTVASKGCMTLTITLLGHVSQDRAVRRAGAQPGDRILVTGTIGDAALGLALRMGTLKVADPDEAGHFRDRHNRPEPRVAFGVWMQESALAHAAIDISDGFVADLRRLCLASGVGARVGAARVPLSNGARRQVMMLGDGMLGKLLTGGEDYELIVTAPAGGVEAMMKGAASVGVALTDVGEIVAGDDVVVLLNDEPLYLGKGGWTHF